jgi:ATP synthase protein I
MADGTHDETKPGAKSSEEAALSARLRNLGARLDHTELGRPQVARDSGGRGISDASGLGRALRLSAEMVGGVIVGAGLGLGLDYLLGTSPWAFIVLLLLGFAGGVLSVMRSAGVLPQNRL